MSGDDTFHARLDQAIREALRFMTPDLDLRGGMSMVKPAGILSPILPAAPAVSPIGDMLAVADKLMWAGRFTVPPPPPSITLDELRTVMRDLAKYEPYKVVMSTAHLDAVREIAAPAPQPWEAGYVMQYFALPVEIDENATIPRLVPLLRKPKRSDVTTQLLLEHVAQFGPWAWERLCQLFPAKVVLAAIRREVDRKRLDYGVAERRPFLTGTGGRWLREHSKDQA